MGLWKGAWPDEQSGADMRATQNGSTMDGLSGSDDGPMSTGRCVVSGRLWRRTIGATTWPSRYDQKISSKKKIWKRKKKSNEKAPPPPRADEKRHSFVHSFVSPNFSVPSSLFFRFSSFVVRQESPTRSTSLSVNVWMCASFLLFFLGPDKTSLLSVSIRGVQNEFFGLFSLSLSLSLLMRRLFGPRFSPPVSRCLPSSETRNSLPEHCRGNCDRIAYKIAFPFFFVLGRFGRLATGLPSFTGFFWQRIP